MMSDLLSATFLIGLTALRFALPIFLLLLLGKTMEKFVPSRF